MAATRLSDSQKSELVERFRAGASSQELAGAFGCSANTVTRVVRAAIDPEDYERLKQARAGGRRPSAAATPSVSPAPASAAAPPPPQAGPQEPEADLGEEEADGPGVLAIDDADDFGDDADADIDADEDGDESDELGGDRDAGEMFVTVPVMQAPEARGPAQVLPLAEAVLPSSVYMLVDKTVELQARPLSDFPELGVLPQEEAERQALLVFANPRQAKRQCGRSQRVIKLPDSRVLERTSSYLLAQGISRVVLEGSLYALPGS